MKYTAAGTSITACAAAVAKLAMAICTFYIGGLSGDKVIYGK